MFEWRKCDKKMLQNVMFWYEKMWKIENRKNITQNMPNYIHYI